MKPDLLIQKICQFIDQGCTSHEVKPLINLLHKESLKAGEMAGKKSMLDNMDNVLLNRQREYFYNEMVK